MTCDLANWFVLTNKNIKFRYHFLSFVFKKLVKVVLIFAGLGYQRMKVNLLLT